MGRGIYHYNLPPSPGGNVRVVGEKIPPWRESGKNGEKKVKRKRNRKRREKENDWGKELGRGNKQKRGKARSGGREE